MKQSKQLSLGAGDDLGLVLEMTWELLPSACSGNSQNYCPSVLEMT
jgi:hypothetical protein